MKSFVIIGLGRFGMALSKELSRIGHEVLAIDYDPALISEVADYVTHAVEADAKNEMALKEIGLSNFDVAVISIGSDLEASIIATLTCKELGIKTIIAKATSESHGKVLSKIGANKIIFPERDMGTRLAHNLTFKNIIDYIELSSDYSIAEVKILKSWVGKSLLDLKLRNIYGVNVIAIKNDDKIDVSPKPDKGLEQGDVLVLLGQVDDISALEKDSQNEQ
ncbi:TrkA family potassium uptake protein [uncultured Fenollaria sp.]|uniref:potassium channel family protein n=1 Tax=uncultured Fenollaria sp. TaxID=1686315 RepID=UPI0025CCC7D5|nr:TrkA family potassium uptake protein [uncultured Fenollaria sp.]